MKKYFDADNDVFLALLQICRHVSTPIGPGLQSPAALMSNRSIRCLIAKLRRSTILFDHDDDHYASLIERQQTADRNKYTDKRSLLLSTVLTVAVQHEDDTTWTYGILV